MRRRLFPLGFAGALIFVSPAYAEWQAIASGETVSVANGKIEVTPEEGWNRSTASAAKMGETWTADGVALNELTFFAAVEEGDTLYRDMSFGIQKMPQFKSSMVLPDIPELFEKSNRLLLNTSAFAMEKVEAARFSGRPAVRFSYRYALPEDLLERRGEAIATIADGKLYLVNFVAPSIHYFGYHLPAVRRLFSSIKLPEPKADAAD